MTIVDELGFGGDVITRGGRDNAFEVANGIANPPFGAGILVKYTLFELCIVLAFVSFESDPEELGSLVVIAHNSFALFCVGEATIFGQVVEDLEEFDHALDSFLDRR